jgi:DNA-binding protein H-NS
VNTKIYGLYSLSLSLYGHLNPRAPKVAFTYRPPNREQKQHIKKLNLDALTIDEMWQLHEEIGRVLSVRLTSEKRELEKRLAQLRRESEMSQSKSTDRQLKEAPRQRRKYPPVFPKYRNPNKPFETWSGRGKQPRWLTAALKTGQTIEQFVIGNLEANKKNLRRQRGSAATDGAQRGI